MFNRAIAIREKVLGPDHADVATVLGSRAELLLSQVRVESFRVKFGNRGHKSRLNVFVFGVHDCLHILCRTDSILRSGGFMGGPELY